jgi:hypothetical protein
MTHRPLFPVRCGESESEHRLRESLDRQMAQILRTIDAAIELRSAPGDAARSRHLARSHLVEAGLLAMHAHAIVEAARAAAPAPAEPECPR